MTELAIVVGIIALMGAVALPSVAAFLRNYAIESTAKEIASEIQTARYKAISRNVNIGVLFVVLDAQSYRYVIEDDLDLQTAPNWTSPQTLPTLLGRPDQLGPRKLLPTGVQFDTTGATDPAFRYNRFGGWCQPNVDPECPDVTGFTGTEYVKNDVSGAEIRLIQPETGLSRTISVGTGGRVIVEPN
jgi:hypothetical protein